MTRRLVINEERRKLALEAATEAAFEVNDKRELSYTTEALIEAAVRAAIDKMEELLG